MLPENIFFAIVIASSTFGVFFLIKDIVKGKTQLNLVTWFFWALAPLVGVFLQIRAGAGISVLPIFLAGFFPIIIFLLAWIKRKSYWKITSFDIMCGVFSLLALIIYVLTRRTDISILFAILSDLFAAIPTLIKSWHFPDTETALGYLPGIINNSLGLFMIKDWSFSLYSFSIYFIVLNITLIFFIIRKRFLR